MINFRELRIIFFILNSQGTFVLVRKRLRLCFERELREFI